MPSPKTTLQRHLIPFLSLLLTVGCGESSQSPGVPQTAVDGDVLPEVLDRAIEAHGGLDRWRSFGALEYDVQKGDKKEHLLVDLHARQLLLTGDGYTIGFDGSNAWVMPEREAFSGTPRFYSSLDFYFFGLPFLLADPGTIHESIGTRTIDERTYDVLKVSYEPGVGDSPDDYYLPHFNSDGIMNLVLYTVTYKSQAPNERYSARTYEWQEVDGLRVPSKISSFRWDSEAMALGEHRFDVLFSNVSLRRERPDRSIFEMPEGADVDALPHVPPSD